MVEKIVGSSVGVELLKLGIDVLRPLRVSVPLRKSREAPDYLRNVFPRISPVLKLGSTSALIIQFW